MTTWDLIVSLLSYLFDNSWHAYLLWHPKSVRSTITGVCGASYHQVPLQFFQFWSSFSTYLSCAQSIIQMPDSELVVSLKCQRECRLKGHVLTIILWLLLWWTLCFLFLVLFSCYHCLAEIFCFTIALSWLQKILGIAGSRYFQSHGVSIRMTLPESKSSWCAAMMKF